MASQPLIINGFDKGIADSPHKGFGLIKLADIEAFPGAAKVQKKPITVFHTAISETFTADPDTDICTVAVTTVPITGTAVTVSNSGGGLPTGLSASTNYFVIKISSSTFKLATTIANATAGTAINITSAGTGTHTVTTVNPGSVNHQIKDLRTGTIFLIDSNGRVWYDEGTQALLLNGNTLTNGAGNGLGILLNSDSTATYLFVFRNALIDVVNVFGTTQKEAPSWTSGWQTMNSGAGSGNRHYSISAQDGLIYYTDDRYIGSIKELTIFDPATGSTFTWTSQALDLPINEISVHLEELGLNLLIAGSTFNKVYPWDRVSDSFNLPIPFPENNIQRLKNIGGIVYVLVGTYGNIYSTQGSYVKFVKKIPDQVANNSGTIQTNIVTWGGIDALGSALLFGAGVLTSGNSGAYLLYPDGRLILDQIPSTGSANVTSFQVTNNLYRMGYSGGADKLDSSRYTSFETVIQSEFYKVATKTNKTAYSVLEVVIAKPASSGNVRISYRTDTSSSFTTIDTFAADSSATTFKNDAIGLIDIENIQIQAEMDGTMELMEIRLLP